MSNHDVFALFILKRLDDYIVKSLRHERRSKTTGLSFAEVPQTGNQIVWALQHRCKQETKQFGSCNNVANKKPNGSGSCNNVANKKLNGSGPCNNVATLSNKIFRE